MTQQEFKKILEVFDLSNIKHIVKAFEEELEITPARINNYYASFVAKAMSSNLNIEQKDFVYKSLERAVNYFKEHTKEDELIPIFSFIKQLFIEFDYFKNNENEIKSAKYNTEFVEKVEKLVKLTDPVPSMHEYISYITIIKKLWETANSVHKEEFGEYFDVVKSLTGESFFGYKNVFDRAIVDTTKFIEPLNNIKYFHDLCFRAISLYQRIKAKKTTPKSEKEYRKPVEKAITEKGLTSLKLGEGVTLVLTKLEDQQDAAHNVEQLRKLADELTGNEQIAFKNVMRNLDAKIEFFHIGYKEIKMNAENQYTMSDSLKKKFQMMAKDLESKHPELLRQFRIKISEKDLKEQDMLNLIEEIGNEYKKGSQIPIKKDEDISSYKRMDFINKISNELIESVENERMITLLEGLKSDIREWFNSRDKIVLACEDMISDLKEIASAFEKLNNILEMVNSSETVEVSEEEIFVPEFAPAVAKRKEMIEKIAIEDKDKKIKYTGYSIGAEVYKEYITFIENLKTEVVEKIENKSKNGKIIGLELWREMWRIYATVPKKIFGNYCGALNKQINSFIKSLATFNLNIFPKSIGVSQEFFPKKEKYDEDYKLVSSTIAETNKLVEELMKDIGIEDFIVNESLKFKLEEKVCSKKIITHVNVIEMLERMKTAAKKRRFETAVSVIDKGIDRFKDLINTAMDIRGEVFFKFSTRYPTIKLKTQEDVLKYFYEYIASIEVIEKKIENIVNKSALKEKLTPEEKQMLEGMGRLLPEKVDIYKILNKGLTVLQGEKKDLQILLKLFNEFISFEKGEATEEVEEKLMNKVKAVRDKIKKIREDEDMIQKTFKDVIEKIKQPQDLDFKTLLENVAMNIQDAAEIRKRRKTRKAALKNLFRKSEEINIDKETDDISDAIEQLMAIFNKMIDVANELSGYIMELKTDIINMIQEDFKIISETIMEAEEIEEEVFVEPEGELVPAFAKKKEMIKKISEYINNSSYFKEYDISGNILGLTKGDECEILVLTKTDVKPMFKIGDEVIVNDGNIVDSGTIVSHLGNKVYKVSINGTTKNVIEDKIYRV